MRRNFNYLLLFLFLFLIIVRFSKSLDPIFSWDVFGYYLYLPAIFIYDDIRLLNHDWINNLIAEYKTTATLYQAYKVNSGNWLIRYTMGNAILLFPFFLLSQLVAPLLNYPTDGFSLPYRVLAAVGGIFYACLGLFFQWKILITFFRKNVSVITLLVIFLGTNYVQLVTDGTLLTHNFLFTLYSVLIYYTIKWHKEQRLKYMFLLSLAIGLIIIVRPTEGVCVLIPILWNIYDKDSFQNKIKILKRNLLQISVGIIVIFITILPQLLYWKLITGNFFIDSYNYPGEGLDIFSPHTWNFLFSFRKGWFIYTPIIFFAFTGFYFLYRNNKNILLALIVFIIVDVWIISSWTVWWYTGASYSQRAIIPAYVILSIPLGYFVQNLLNHSKNIQYSYYMIGIFLMLLNLFQWWQFDNGIISKERMTKEYYFAVFGKTNTDEQSEKLLLVDRSVEADEYFKNKENYTSKIIFYDDFTRHQTETDTAGVFILNENNPYSPGLTISFKEITKKDHAWLIIETSIFIPEDFEGELPVVVAAFHHKGKPYKYKAKELSAADIKYNDWNKITFDYLTPEVRNKKDELKVYVWHRAKNNVLLDYLKVEAFEKIK